LDYVLDKVLDPSAIVAEDFRLTKVFLKSGVQVEGIIKQRNNKAITLLERVGIGVARRVIPIDQIEVEEKSALSMMPDGLFDRPMTQVQVRDLIFYLKSPKQVPLPEEKKAAAQSR